MTRYFSAFCTEVNMPVTLPPTSRTAAMIATLIPDAIIAYSIDVAALVSRQNPRSRAS